MAFATQNVKLSSNGDLWQLVGECTSNVGDADGTITVGGSRVYQAWFHDETDTTPSTQPLSTKIVESTTTNSATITVNVSNGVVRGRFLIVYR